MLVFWRESATLAIVILLEKKLVYVSQQVDTCREDERHDQDLLHQ